MALRQLEAAIQAGKAIQKENYITFKQIAKSMKYKFDREKDGIFSLQYSLDSSFLAVGYGDGGIHTLDTTSGQMLKEIRLGTPNAKAITSLRFHPMKENEIWASTSEGTIYSGNTSTGLCSFLLIVSLQSEAHNIEDKPADHSSTSQFTLSQVMHGSRSKLFDQSGEHGNEINCMDFNKAGNSFATAGKDLTIRVYDAETLQNLHSYSGYEEGMLPVDASVMGHAMRIFSVKYHPDHSNVLISAGWDNMIMVWDCRTSSGLQRIISGPHVAGDGLDIKDNQILTASWLQEDALQLWDFGQGQLVKNIPFQVKKGEPGAYLYCGQFCSSSVVVAGGSGTKNVQAINIHSGKLLNEIDFKKPVYSLDITQFGRHLAIGGAGKKLLLAEIS